MDKKIRNPKSHRAYPEPPSILVISDAHIPFNHPQSLLFLDAVATKYHCTVYKSVGDLLDHAAVNYHEKEYGLPDPQQELELSKKELKKWEERFPNMTICSSNHGDLPLRKAKTAGIPADMIKDYNQIYGLKTFIWVEEEYFDIGYGQYCLLTHTVSGNARTNANKFSHCSVQGHHHSEYGVHYYADHASLRWHAATGCLIDPDSPAFNYNRGILKRPILGCAVIVDSLPYLIPMRLKPGGKWLGRI